MNESPVQRQERLQRLKQRAQELIERQAVDVPTPEARETAKLLEDLRVYQVELEVQNEELRRAQQDTAMSQARYRVLFEQMPLPALVLDAKGHIEHCNTRAGAWLEPRKSYNARDNRLFDSLARDDRNRLHMALRDFVCGQPTVLEKLTLVTAHQRELLVDAHLIQLSGDFHLDPHVLALLIDRSAEVARDQERSFFAAMLDGSDNLVCAVDLQGRLLMANRAMLRFLGCNASDVIGQRREQFMPVRDAALHNEADRKVVASGEPVTLEERVHLGAQGAIDLVTRKFPVRDPEGRIHAVGAICTDVTELRAQHELARLSESVFKMASEAIIVTDPETRIERVNPAFCAQSGFSPAAVVGHVAHFVKGGGQDDTAYQAMWDAARRDGRWAGELHNRAADGHEYTVWSSLSAIHDERGKVVRYVAIQTDMSALKAAQAQIQQLALFDSLTGLPNRVLFEDRIRTLIGHAQRHHQPFALVFADLDHFKEVNDTLGHGVGDELLRQVALRLKGAVRSEDTVARLGGDEFVVLLPAANRETAHGVADKLLASLRQPMGLGELPVYQPTASAGVAVYPDDGTTAAMLLRNADTAMYRAKQGGRNRAIGFDLQMASENAVAFAVQTDLAAGIVRRELRLHYQPQFNLRTGALVGAEALVRWQRPGKGLMMPAEFLPVAEKTGLVSDIDRWVLGEALRQVSAWTAVGLWPTGCRVAVNQTARDLRNPDLLGQLQGLLLAHRLSPSVLEIEITEGALVEHTDEILDHLMALRDLGVALTIDDFGTYYSGLANLRRLPVKVIKVDRSFVRNMTDSECDRVLVDTIIAMAHNLGHTLVAEGIENELQRAHLLERGCEVGQGYLLGRPMPADEFAAQFLPRPFEPGLH